jgi:PAT family beta-lactamase induction signal transducer AmpG
MEVNKLFKLWRSKNIWLLIFVGFSSGLPATLSAGTLQAWLTKAGVGVVSIGLFSLVGMPYTYKFLWAPLLDKWVPPWLGRRRGWMLLTQVGLIISLSLMAVVGVKSSLLLIASLAFLTAFLSATQDTSIDAYRTDLLSLDERGLGSAVFIAGWRLGALVSGGLALIIAAYLGWKATYFVMAALMLVGLLTTLFASKPTYAQSPPVNFRAAVIEPFKEFFQRSYGVWVAAALLLFVVIYKFSDALALSLMSTFLLRGVGFSLVTVGAVFKIFGVFAIMLGLFVGGVLIPYLKLFKSLLLFGFLQCLANLMFMWLAIAGKNHDLLIAAVVLDNLAGGMSTAAFLAFLMGLCEHRFTATQFALLSALASLGRVFLGPVAGFYVAHFSWASLYFWSFLLGLPALLLLCLLRRRILLD